MVTQIGGGRRLIALALRLHQMACEHWEGYRAGRCLRHSKERSLGCASTQPSQYRIGRRSTCIIDCGLGESNGFWIAILRITLPEIKTVLNNLRIYNGLGGFQPMVSTTAFGTVARHDLIKIITKSVCYLKHRQRFLPRLWIIYLLAGSKSEPAGIHCRHDAPIVLLGRRVIRQQAPPCVEAVPHLTWLGQVSVRLRWTYLKVDH